MFLLLILFIQLNIRNKTRLCWLWLQFTSNKRTHKYKNPISNHQSCSSTKDWRESHGGLPSFLLFHYTTNLWTLQKERGRNGVIYRRRKGNPFCLCSPGKWGVSRKEQPFSLEASVMDFTLRISLRRRSLPRLHQQTRADRGTEDAEAGGRLFSISSWKTKSS